MLFNLTIQHAAYTYSFQVERTKEDQAFEQFRLSASGRVVVVQSNRPMLQRRGLKHKPITWKVVEGQVKDTKALEKVYKAIEEILTQPKQASNSTDSFPSLPARSAMRQPNKRKNG